MGTPGLEARYTMRVEHISYERSPPEATGRSIVLARAGGDERLRKINLIGANAYSSTGGIQAVNRTLVREIDQLNLLRRAFFLWDDDTSSRSEAHPFGANGRIRSYALNHRRFVTDILSHATTHPGDIDRKSVV